MGRLFEDPIFQDRVLTSPVRRRSLTLTTLLCLDVVAVLAFPVLAVLAVLADLVLLQRRFRHVRVLTMLLATLAIETAGVIGCGALWVASFGRPRRLPGAHRRLQRLWTMAFFRAADATLGLTMSVAGLDDISPGPKVVIGRHTSIGDAIIPALVFSGPLDRRLRYVLKEDLLLGPCLDIVGNRLPNYFLRRSAPAPDDLAALRTLTEDLGDDEVAVIFPEGTFFRPRLLQRAIERVGERHPERLPSLQKLNHLLPVRPGGTLAMLAGNEDADLVLVGHVGFERFSSLGRIYRSVPFREPVDVRLWEFARTDIPTADDELVAWLDARWNELDDWVADRLADRQLR